MVGTVCVPGGDHFSRYRNFGLDVCEPEELAEDEEIFAISRRLIAENHPAYEELAK